MSIMTAVLDYFSDGREERPKVRGGEAGQGFGRDAAKVREEGGGVDDEGWLIALAAMRDGGEERGVGFNEDAVGGGEGCGVSDALGLRVGEVSSEREVEAEIE